MTDNKTLALINIQNEIEATQKTLKKIHDNLQHIIDTPNTQPPPQPLTLPTVQPTNPPEILAVKIPAKIPIYSIPDVKNNLPSDLLSELEFFLQNNHINVYLKTWLDNNNFTKLYDAMKKIDGLYVSDGKNSHFTITTTKETTLT